MIGKNLINRYHIRDARRISALLPDKEIINVTITSPPYWDLKDYGTESQIGFGQTYNRYLDDLEKVFRDIYDATTKKGSLWIISDTIKHKGKIVLLPFDLANRLEKIGWILQDIIIWKKDRTLPWSHEGKLRNIFEYITFYSKARKFNYHLNRVREVTALKEWWVRYPERYSPKGKAPARTWYIPIPRQGSWGDNWVRHFNPLPPELIERILMLTTNEGDVVLDPFSGSGTVLAQANVMRRRYIGLDLNKEYKEMFQKQVLPAIRNLHEARQNETKGTASLKKTFAHLIRSLRKTKYPKEIVRLYQKKYEQIELEGVFALQGADAGCLDVTFLFTHVNQIPEDFVSRVTELCKRPPLSKYGIKSELASCTINNLSEGWFRKKGLDFDKHLYLYTNGRTYSWEKKMSIREFLEAVKNGGKFGVPKQSYPVIVSNIKVKANRKSPIASIEKEL